ncbi:hypothetical protein L0Z72_15385 [candidate division KSB1 bacterium]|nr:hypothetical protein [candidate division KSB1 bacterium]
MSHCEERSDEAKGAPLACNLQELKGLLRFARNDIFEPCYMINLNEYIWRFYLAARKIDRSISEKL